MQMGNHNIDLNEIGGWIGHCGNVECLRTIRNHIDNRLRELGVSPEAPPPQPLTDEVLRAVKAVAAEAATKAAPKARLGEVGGLHETFKAGDLDPDTDVVVLPAGRPARRVGPPPRQRQAVPETDHTFLSEDAPLPGMEPVPGEKFVPPALVGGEVSGPGAPDEDATLIPGTTAAGGGA